MQWVEKRWKLILKAKDSRDYQDPGGAMTWKAISRTAESKGQKQKHKITLKAGQSFHQYRKGKNIPSLKTKCLWSVLKSAHARAGAYLRLWFSAGMMLAGWCTLPALLPRPCSPPSSTLPGLYRIGSSILVYFVSLKKANLKNTLFEVCSLYLHFIFNHYSKIVKECRDGEFPGASVVRPLCFPWSGPGFNPWSGN